MVTPPSLIEKLVDGVIGREGGYSNHPADKGGATRWGVTEQVARAYGFKGDMRVLPRETAVTIYTRQYWADPGFGDVATRFPDVAALLFDIGVNQGTGMAATFLQRVLNVLNQGATTFPDLVVDGRLGQLTYHALDSFKQRRGVEGGEVLYEAIDGLRRARYIEISEARPANEAFTYGWLRRVVEMVKARVAA